MTIESEYCVFVSVMVCMVCVEKMKRKKVETESAHLRDQCYVTFCAWRARGRGATMIIKWENADFRYFHACHACVVVCGDVLVLVLDSRHKCAQFDVLIMVL